MMSAYEYVGIAAKYIFLYYSLQHRFNHAVNILKIHFIFKK